LDGKWGSEQNQPNERIIIMNAETNTPRCRNCQYSAKYAPVGFNAKATLRCVRYAPRPEIINTGSMGTMEHYFPNYPVVFEDMFCGEFEAK
jgi:hypothetical protein